MKRRKCISCGKKLNKGKKYCSYLCGNKYTGKKRRVNPEKNCAFCGKLFRGFHKYNKYCSIKCAGLAERGENNPAYKRGEKLGPNFTCYYCKKDFYRPPSHINKNTQKIYCSKECMYENQKKLKIGIHKGYKNGSSKKERIQKFCLYCQKSFLTLLLKQKFCSRECFNKGILLCSYDKRAEKNPNWKGGSSKHYDYSRFLDKSWIKQRRLTKKRDNYICQVCGIPRKLLDAHHIIPWDISKDSSLDNLISLCRNCHTAIDAMTRKNLKLFYKIRENCLEIKNAA